MLLLIVWPGNGGCPPVAAKCKRLWHLLTQHRILPQPHPGYVVSYYYGSVNLNRFQLACYDLALIYEYSSREERTVHVIHCAVLSLMVT